MGGMLAYLPLSYIQRINYSKETILVLQSVGIYLGLARMRYSSIGCRGSLLVDIRVRCALSFFVIPSKKHR